MRTKYTIVSIVLLSISLSAAYMHYSPIPPRNLSGFMYLNGVRLNQPLSDSSFHSAMEHAFSTLQDTGVNAVLQSTIGAEEEYFADTHEGTEGAFNEIEYISGITKMAQEHGVPLVLGLHLVENRVPNVRTETDGLDHPQTQVTADEILYNQEIQSAFLHAVDERIAAYRGTHTESPIAHNCSIILFDDTTPYRMFDSSGIFWLGDAYKMGSVAEEDMTDHRIIAPHPPMNGANDMRFVRTAAALFSLMKEHIQSQAPECTVGAYLHYSTFLRTFEGTPLLGHFVGLIPPHLQPDFVMVRIFSKSYVTFDEYVTRAETNIPRIRNILKPDTDLFLIGQLHTTNEQGHGPGRTPSLQQLTDTISLVRQLPVDSFGYLGKDVHPTSFLNQVSADIDGDGTEEVAWACEYYHYTHQHMKNIACSPEEDSEPFAPNYHDGHHLLIVPDEKSGTQRFEKGVELLKTLKHD